MAASRQTALARRDLVRNVLSAFGPVEQGAIQNAVDLQRCVALMIEQHRDAALPLGVGDDAIALVAEAARLTLDVRDRVLRAHLCLTGVAKQLRLDHETGFSPYCPPEAMTFEPELRAVA